MKINLKSGKWLNQPFDALVGPDSVKITTEPRTDFWQRTFYGFKNDNAPALLFESTDNFTFTCRAEFEYQHQFDQCGIIVYLNSDHWFKAAIEFEHEKLSRMGSVVTNQGYSDWATTDIKPQGHMWYRLSRRGPDFLAETSFDGMQFYQMRMFHLHSLGQTTATLPKDASTLIEAMPARFGVYASSPSDSTFTAVFTHFRVDECLWKVHETG